MVPYKGPLRDFLYQLVGGLRAGMGYVGAATIRELQSKARFIEVSPAGLKENHPHDVTITKGSAELPVQGRVGIGVRSLGTRTSPSASLSPPEQPYALEFVCVLLLVSKMFLLIIDKNKSYRFFALDSNRLLGFLLFGEIHE